MSYKDNYKSVQLNLLKDKHKELIEWLEELCQEQDRSLNSLIIQLLKKEHERWQKQENAQNVKEN